MNSEILYKSIKKGTGLPVYIDYYIIPESISAAYCDLKCYGIKIQKTCFLGGGGKIIKTQQINNAFYRERDAVEFAEYAASKNTEPEKLREFMEEYIVESIDRAKQTR